MSMWLSWALLLLWESQDVHMGIDWMCMLRWDVMGVVVVESGRSVRGMKVRSRLIKVKRRKVERRTCL